MADAPGGDEATARSRGSRRAFLTASAAAGVILLDACSGSRPLREQVRGSAKVSPADVPQLNRLLDVEHLGIAAYAAGIPLLHGQQAKNAIQFLAQELAHAFQISDLIKRARAKPNLPQASYELGRPQTSQDVLALLKRVERAQLTTYLAALPQLTGGQVRAAVGAIYANDAQHLAMLRWQSGEEPVPSALATGA